MFGAPQLPRTLEAALRDLGGERDGRAGASKPAVRAEAARDLVAHASSARDRVVRALQRALRDDGAPEVRAVAATALADANAHEALADLLLAVEDRDALVRQMAIAALGEIGDCRATERLRRALSDERAEIRFQAVMAFPRVCTSRADALDALLRATHDEDAFVCHIALRMTEELRDGAPAEERVVVRARALLGHRSIEVRVLAAIVLAQADDRRARDLLTDVARGELRTRDREDEAAAIELAGELGLEAARPGLEKRAFGGLLGLRRDRFAWHARVALARMGHERARSEILGELGARDRDVRTLAVAAAGRARIAAARDPILAMRGNDARADPHAVDEALAALADAGTGPLLDAPGGVRVEPSGATT